MLFVEDALNDQVADDEPSQRNRISPDERLRPRDADHEEGKYGIRAPDAHQPTFVLFLPVREKAEGEAYDSHHRQQSQLASQQGFISVHIPSFQRDTADCIIDYEEY